MRDWKRANMKGKKRGPKPGSALRALAVEAARAVHLGDRHRETLLAELTGIRSLPADLP